MPHTHATNRQNRHVVAARLRPGAPRPDGRPAGERDREVHFVVLLADAPTPLQFSTLCGRQLTRDSADLIDTITGMPCALCLARIPQPRSPRA